MSFFQKMAKEAYEHVDKGGNVLGISSTSENTHGIYLKLEMG